uniref:Uncharacterized protein n=1 Tax=Marinobacter nauticus TaxID=2743 RepID=A0A455WHW6_MARNT|nr:hypothetical protein YBY_29770 [Marinobacter nauticus]
MLLHSWYLNHVIVGAKETGVPADYLDAIAATPSQENPDRRRDARERGQLQLAIGARADCSKSNAL